MSTRRLWANRRYVVWLISDTSKGLATTLASFALPLIVLVVTNDPAQAGIIAGAGMAVRLVVTLYGGVLADRHPRIGLMLLGGLCATAVAAAFTVLAVTQALTFLTLFAVELLLMIRAGLFEPASESALKEIVPSETMGRAQAANQGRDAALQLAGGPLGGVLLGVGGWLVGVAMTIGYALATLTAWMLRHTDPGSAHQTVGDSTTKPDRRSGWREMKEGFGWLFSRPDLSGGLLLTTIVNLGFNIVITTVVYSLQQDGYSELTIGALSAAMGAVMLAGAFVAPLLVPRIRTGLLTVTGLGAATAAAILVSMLDNPWWIALVLGCSVLLLPALNASLMGYFMVATPSELLGRANSAAGVLGMGAMPLAPLVAGFGLAWVGRTNTILVGAVLCAVSVVLAVANRGLRALPVEAGWSAHAATFAGSPSVEEEPAEVR